ncbi:S41 family peptidase [Tundrisphaera sp. TA3]|uniref:S41 family peptidase n=1 Tax=Tundrisphaera sp. TA3 TaxID=3435775 RepID=UPI003EB76583
MMRSASLALLLCLASAGPALAREAKLARYPHYHDGQVVFSYLGDLWTAREDGTGISRLTANKARDAYPRFSPDGKWVAFSSDREGGLDVHLIPASGGPVKRLTVHSADDVVLGWSPDGKSVLFSSQRGEDFMGKLYLVPVEGGMARNAGPDMGVSGGFSPDGTKLAINRKAQSYWRKYYRGAYQSDVTVMDLATKTFRDLTDFDGMDSWPMWGRDGRIYFVSDRDPGAQANLWAVPEGGGEAAKVTQFTDGDVRFPSISSDGKTIVFERDFGISKLDVATGAVTPLHFDIAAETQESLTEVMTFDSAADDYDLAPNGRRVAFVVHGEIFTAPTEEGGELRQITDDEARDQEVGYSPDGKWITYIQITDDEARDQEVGYSPDGKWITYISDRDGREEIYVVASDGAGEPKRLTDIDALKSSYAWSPDGKTLAFTTADGKLYTMTAEGKDLKELAASRFGPFGRPAWSPDGRWLAYTRNDVTRSTDVYLLPASGGEEHKVTYDASNEQNPRFSSDGKKLYFTRFDGDAGGSERPSAQIFCIPLERIDKDPDEVESAATPDAPADAMNAVRRELAARNAPPREPKIDWAGLKRRTRQVTRAGSVRTYIPGNDGKTLIFVGTESGGGSMGGPPSIYTIQDDGKKLNRVTQGSALTPTSEGEGAPRGGRRGPGGGGISNLALTRDGRTLFYLEGSTISSTPISGGGGSASAVIAMLRPGGSGGGPGAATPAPVTSSGGGPRRRISFNVAVEVEKPREWAEMFDDAWRTMKYRFYDAKMHGKDWDAMRARYRPLVESVGDRHELMNLINEMIGELNASHTGASAAGGGNQGATTRHLGLELDADDAAGRYKVAHVYEDGPADKDWIKLRAGDYLIAIDGKPLRAGDNYWKALGRRLNPRVELTVNDRPDEAGAWKVKYEPVSMSAYATLRYERWVKGCRAKVDELSGGRVGYLHIKAMDQPSLARFRRDLNEYRHKEALVIDQRWNGGGNIEQELLAILVQRPYQVWHPRGTEPTSRPSSGFFGPKVVLQNWRSASNAEMFPAGFRALGLGRVVGTPTMGAVIGTGSYTLMDGSTIRTPGVGVYLADEGHTNMENAGVKPDVFVENTPEDNLAGRDRQLEAGVREVMKDLKEPASPMIGDE